MENVKKERVRKFLSQVKFWTLSTLDWTDFCEYTESIHDTNVYMITFNDLHEYINVII
jgi:hypothetical protein